jgi:hypothetical protein
LDAEISELIASFPEYSMGAHRVALVMKDGSVVEDVIVPGNDEVVRVAGVDGCPLNVDEVVDARD